jgi:hypothetical protein
MMNNEDQELFLARLKAGSQEEKEEAASAIAKSGTPHLLQQLWLALDQDTPEGPVVSRGASDGFIDGAPETIPVLIHELKSHSKGAVVRVCAYALGEISYNQGAERDEQIPAALVEALQQLPAPDSKSASPFVAALRECARGKPVPAATPILKKVLDNIAGEKEIYLFCLDNVLETLYLNEGRIFLDELTARLRAVGQATEFTEVLVQFLASHLPGKGDK